MLNASFWLKSKHKELMPLKKWGPVHETTASKFLSIGLDLENQQ
jgi:hypothetical protein